MILNIKYAHRHNVEIFLLRRNYAKTTYGSLGRLLFFPQFQFFSDVQNTLKKYFEITKIKYSYKVF